MFALALFLIVSNFWKIVGILIGARSRLYRRRFLDVYNRLKALDEIYMIYTFLHRSNLQIHQVS